MRTWISQVVAMNGDPSGLLALVLGFGGGKALLSRF